MKAPRKNATAGQHDYGSRRHLPPATPHFPFPHLTHLTYFILLALSLVFGPVANAALYQNTFSSGFANGGNIPDGNTAGWSDMRTISIADNSIVGLEVKLNITGGFNGDLYGYISHNGILIPLVNRVGVSASPVASSFGYSDAGFNVTLSDSGSFDIHYYGQHSPTISGGQLTGTWQPDGRNINPASSGSTFDSATAGRVSFSSLANQDPNGEWTLFFADMSGGGGTSHIVSWELDITAVPEPVNVALVVLAGGLGIIELSRRKFRVRTTS